MTNGLITASSFSKYTSSISSKLKPEQYSNSTYSLFLYPIANLCKLPDWMTSGVMSGFAPSRVGGATALPSSLALDPKVCPLCLSVVQFEESTTLICGHSFCKHCLRQRTDGNILSCPTCQTQIDLGDHGLESSHSNYLISNILQLVTSPDDLRLTTTSAESIFQSQWTQDFSTASPPSNHSCQLCHSCDSSVEVSSQFLLGN